MNKQNLIKQLERDLNKFGLKTYLYADGTQLNIYNNLLGSIITIDLQTSFITTYEYVNLEIVDLVMEFKKQLEVLEGLI